MFVCTAIGCVVDDVGFVIDCVTGIGDIPIGLSGRELVGDVNLVLSDRET